MAAGGGYLRNKRIVGPAALQVPQLLRKDLGERRADHVLVRRDVDVEQVVAELRVRRDERVRVARDVGASICEIRQQQKHIMNEMLFSVCVCVCVFFSTIYSTTVVI